MNEEYHTRIPLTCVSGSGASPSIPDSGRSSYADLGRALRRANEMSRKEVTDIGVDGTLKELERGRKLLRIGRFENVLRGASDFANRRRELGRVP